MSIAGIEKIEQAERAYREVLLRELKETLLHVENTPKQSPAAQWIFCMDIRGEPLRRAIEQQSSYETFGTSGAFGLPVHLSKHVPFETRCQYAENLLRTIGLTNHFAPLVILCGHRGTTANHRYAKLFNCVACQGQPGGEHAQAMVNILNQKTVRNALKKQDIIIPDNTVFIAAEHHTATQRVKLYHPPSLANSLEILRVAQNDQLLPKHTEHGPINNASFIIGPRAITKTINLHARAFLHSYDWEQDPEGQYLETILTGPLIVAHKINRRYFLKSLGQPLPKDDELPDVPAAGHQPLRLLVVIVAPHTHVAEIIKRQPQLQQLLHDHWITIATLDPKTHEIL